MRDKSFIDLKTEEVAAYKEGTLKKIEIHKHPLRLLSNEGAQIESQLTATHNSNIVFNEIFFKLRDKSIENKNLIHIELCEQYCNENKIPRNESELFFPKLFALYEMRSWILEKACEIEDFAKEEEIEAKEIQDGEYTLTRRLIALETLLKAAGNEIEFGKTGVNKMKIAEFVHFIISNDNEPKDQRDTSLYKRVKTIWDKIENSNPENIQYVSDQFSNIGLSNLSEQLKQIIKSQEKKKI